MSSEKITLGTGHNERTFKVENIITENFKSKKSFKDNWLIEDVNTEMTFKDNVLTWNTLGYIDADGGRQRGSSTVWHRKFIGKSNDDPEGLQIAPMSTILQFEAQTVMKYDKALQNNNNFSAHMYGFIAK